MQKKVWRGWDSNWWPQRCLTCQIGRCNTQLGSAKTFDKVWGNRLYTLSFPFWHISFYPFFKIMLAYWILLAFWFMLAYWTFASLVGINVKRHQCFKIKHPTILFLMFHTFHKNFICFILFIMHTGLFIILPHRFFS